MKRTKKQVPAAVRTSFLAALVAIGLGVLQPLMAQEHPTITTPDDARLRGLESLRVAVKKSGGVPLPPDLNRYVRDSEAAVQLGKAIFWDMQVGSDGIQSCASCHFHAGADSRAKNQMNPSLLRVKNIRDGDVKGFFNAANVPHDGFEFRGPNSTLSASDFPFVRNPNQWIMNPDGGLGPAAGNTNDVASSQGVFFTLFRDVVRGGVIDSSLAQTDPVWNVHGGTVRRVEPRQTPTTINAVFNFHNFWDGRANNEFNGQNPFGDQDPSARIYVAVGSNLKLREAKVVMRNASLASQAVGPPLSFFEMSAGNGAENFRTWPELGRKLLTLQPLALQQVSPSDSVLGHLSAFPLEGLRPGHFRDASGATMNGYRHLIQKAFRKELWGGRQAVRMRNPAQIEMPGDASTVLTGDVRFVEIPTSGKPTGDTFEQIEANMAFFFGVSVMLYEATLVADNTPFDQWMETGLSSPGFGETELKGLNVFVNQGKCINCHGGPEFTNASVRNAQNGGNLIEPMLMAQGAALYDNGFYNIGVSLTTDDLGRGGKDLFGRPLAASRQLLFKRLGIQEIPFKIFGDPFPSTSEDGDVVAGVDTDGNGVIDPGEEILIKRAAVDGAFKTPGLRNVELTGPYFHTGGEATLRQVVAFYDHGGNFREFNRPDLDPDIQQLGLTDEQERELVAFLVSLTDHRVRIEAAPFDHPELFLPNGHPGDDKQLILSRTIDGIEQAYDDLDLQRLRLRLPAVGAEGDESRPVGTFLGLSPFAP